MEASKELLDAAFDNATRALQIDSMYPEQRTACEYIDGFSSKPRGSRCVSSNYTVDQVSTLRKKGVSATVVGTNSEANSLIRRGMCSLV